MTSTKITVEVTVNKSKDQTWTYYTKPEHIVNWNFASEDWHCPKAENNMKVGGKNYARMESKDGSMGFDFEATYLDVKLGNSLTYAMSERMTTVVFTEIGAKTQVVITFDAETENPIELQKNGWQAILNNFKKYVETH